MKGRTSTSSQNSVSTDFDDFDMEVAEILRQLPELVLESEYHRFSVTWGAKRRRSTMDLSLSPPRLRSTPSPPSLLRTCGVGEDERPIRKVEATSPATPFSFSPSESDGKSKHSLRKTSKKRNKEEWVEMMIELTQRRELLKGEIETVRRYFHKLSAYNLELKERKQELSLRGNKEEPYLATNESLKLAIELALPTGKSPPRSVENQGHQQIPTVVHQQPPLIMDHSAYRSLSSSSRSGLGIVNHMGPLGIPDLNVSFYENFGMDSFQPFDANSALPNPLHFNRAMAAAQARKNRMKIYRLKNSIAATKPRYGHR